MSNYTNLFFLSVVCSICCGVQWASASSYSSFSLDDPYILSADSFHGSTHIQDTIPLNERYGDFISDPQTNPFDLRDPDVIKKKVEYDPETEQYILTERIGDDYFRAPTYMTFDEYIKYKQEEQERAYFAQLAGLSGGRGFSKREDPMDRIDVSRTMIDRLFGGSTVDIRPQGTIDIEFGVDYQKIDDNSLLPQQRVNSGFDFNMAIQMSLAGKIGKKLSMDVNYNTESTFDFDRVLKLQYDTDAFSDDEIIKKIEAGNVSLPLRNSLIQGSQNLFGLKTELQFGKLRLTAVASQQKSEQQQLRLEGGAQEQEFEVRADNYDENRNFFLSHFNRDNFEKSLERLPQINSQFRITKIEVWVTNDRAEIVNNRDIVALADLGENDVFTAANADEFRRPSTDDRPSNDANRLYRRVSSERDLSSVRSYLTGSVGLQQSRSFEKVSARLLNASEYYYHPELGFISLNIGISASQVVGVAYEYTFNGDVFQVGEFAEEVPQDPESPSILYVKMLKATTPRVDLPIWDLMMKNIYGIGAFQVTDEDFNLDFYYENITTADSEFNIDSRNIPNSSVSADNLIELLNLDELNQQRDPIPDGRFDFVPGLTINTRNGRIMIPKLEPFGSSLLQLMDLVDHPGDTIYTFPQLYDSTVTAAREFTERNRFLIKGSHKSSLSREISLGALNVDPESVRVTAGGKQLQLGTDYDVNPSQGTVTLLRDDLISGGVPVNVNYENQQLFSFQTKTMLGLRADYEVNENFNIGGTYLKLSERPFTQKVNVGDDPINNTVYGLDVNFSTESPFITRMVDKIPMINTKEKSTINVSAEFAALRPGHASAINSTIDEGGTVYIDDFEFAANPTRLSSASPSREWTLASVPTDKISPNSPIPRFPESERSNDLTTGINRAGLSWYSAFSTNLNEDDRNDPYCRILLEQELFPNRALMLAVGTNNIPTLDLNYRPDERGPYNYDVPGGTSVSAGAEFDGREVKLADPGSRWAGIQRGIRNSDFEANNIEYLEFWMLNPYIGKNDAASGKLIIQLGNISEDVVKDSRYFYEHGLPNAMGNGNTDETIYGKVPARQPISASFDADADSRILQDIGYDGLNDVEERDFFADYLSQWSVIAQNRIAADPSNDNFEDIDTNPGLSCIERYERFNAPEGNSPVRTESAATQISKNLPDQEDINNDNTLDESEAYYSYEIRLANAGGDIDPSLAEGRITDQRTISRDGSPDATWYRFRVPLRRPNQTVGGIRDFRSIRFMRMYLTEFEEPIVLRLAEFQLNRSQWRPYQRFEASTGSSDCDITQLEQDAVEIEENSGRKPFNYVLPEGIQREQLQTTFNQGLDNEKSLSLKVCDLACEVGVYKVIDFDLRLYERLKMFVHAEASERLTEQIAPGDVELFLRFGDDLELNYYEYSQPLTLSPYFDMDSLRQNSSENVWLDANSIDINLKELVKFKRSRGRDTPLDTSFSILGNPEFGKADFKGVPNLGDAKSFMIGIRRKDGVPLNLSGECLEFWVNELRVSGLDEKGGIAGLAQVDIQLADFGNLAASYNFSSIGYGGIDQQLIQRQRDDQHGYDLSANLELGKFLPKSSGVKIPFYVQHSVTQSSPEFDPFNEDVRLSESLSDSPEEASVIKERAVDYNSITSVNFTNVRKDRTGDDTPKPWDIENFSVSYSNTKEVQHDPIIEANNVNTRRMGLTYNYTRKGKFIKPFDKVIKNKKYLGWIKEFNFNPLPNSFGFDTELDRRFGEVRYRALADRTYYNKYYNWDRNYSLNWDFTKSLKLTFNAVNRAVIDEPDEVELRKQFDGNMDEINKARNEAIWRGLRDFGRNKSYTHSIDLSYNLPFKHLPYLDWVNVRAQYGASYNWDAASENIVSLGNTIQNSQRRQLNADFDLRKLYKKVSYLNKIETKPRKRKSTRGKKTRGNSNILGSSDLKDDNARRKKGKSRDRRNAPVVKSKDDNKISPNGKLTEPFADPSAPDSGVKSSDPSTVGGTASTDKKEEKKGPREITTLERILVRPLLSVRQVRFTYTRDFRSFVPGFTPDVEYLGLGENLSAPGWKYVTGIQPTRSWLNNAANRENWITEDPELNQQFLLSDRENYDLKFSLEPFRDFKLDVNWNKSEQITHTENFRKYSTGFEGLNPRDIGSYTVSYFMANTLFGTDVNELFNKFSDYRINLSYRLANENANIIGVHPTDNLDGVPYREGYGRLQQDVVVPAFIAAYTGQNPETVSLNLLKLTPRPNWNLRWNGLSKVDFFKKWFTNISLTHGYSSTLTVNSYNSNFDFDTEAFAYRNDDKNQITQNFFARFDIPDILIREQFTPLLGINITTKRGATINFDYKKSRDLSLSLKESGELREGRSTDYTFGFGQKFKNVNIGFLQVEPGSKSRKKRKKSRNQRDAANAKPDPDPKANPNSRGRTTDQPTGSDLNLRVDVSFRDDITITHELDVEGDAIPTRGTKTLSIQPSVDYDINPNLNIRFFFDYRSTRSVVNPPAPILNTAGGINLRFKLN